MVEPAIAYNMLRYTWFTHPPPSIVMESCQDDLLFYLTKRLVTDVSDAARVWTVLVMTNGLFPLMDSDSDSDSDMDSFTMEIFPLVQIQTLIP